MRTLGSVLYLLLRLLCYAALVLVVLGFGSVIVLSVTDACSRLDTGAIVCASDMHKQIAEFGMGVMLVTAFTGLPAIMAIAGFFFLVVKVYRRFTAGRPHPLATDPAAAASVDAPTHRPRDREAGQKSGTGMLVLKAVGVVMAALILLGIVAGILGGGV